MGSYRLSKDCCGLRIERRELHVGQWLFIYSFDQVHFDGSVISHVLCHELLIDVLI